MTDLLPGFREQLEVRAQQLEDRHAPARNRGAQPVDAEARRRGRLRRLHGRGLIVILVAGLAGASGLGYAASRYLWSPPLGTALDVEPGEALPKATASSLPPDQSAAFAVLRRAQTDLDRNVSSRLALTMTGGHEVIRTNAVRRLATGLNGGAAVLIPFAQKRGIDIRAHPNAAGELPVTTRRDEVCIEYVGGFEDAGVVCANTDEMLAGKLSIGESDPQCIQPIQLRDFAKAQRTERAMAAEERRPPIEMACQRTADAPMHTYTVGLVPDGVAAIRLGDGPRARVIHVHDNAWRTEGGSPFGSHVSWLDAHGRT
ncbi:MAG: hypothetical protein AAGC46_21660, partial [Solirubrobacteraceae bacterium]